MGNSWIQKVRMLRMVSLSYQKVMCIVSLISKGSYVGLSDIDNRVRIDGLI